MESVSTAKVWLLGLLGAIGAFISSVYGGWDSAMTTLVIFMAIDYITGLIVAGVFKKSGKSQSGALESRAGFKGLCKKGVVLLIILVAVRLDLAIGSTIIKDGSVIAFIVNETISITENAGLMGVPIPAFITKAIEVLQKKKDVIVHE